MTRPPGTRRHLPNSPFNVPPPPAPPIEQFAVGDRVSHDQYGLGRIVGVEGEEAVVIDFAGRQGRFLSPYAKLAKL
ncbi:CarD family transcriptional regulator [Streptomyces sp. NPDC055239]|uniref:CarD family transcriptional regulator n=1 Tax=Streptomyces sp. NPDC056486 TaxID=3345835 RepID=UPI0036CD9315